jgi:solute carrier family 8 (sodium/calcium exchanger)
MGIQNYPRGRVVLFGDGYNVCTTPKPFLIPGTEILPVGVLAVAYFLTLCFLFLGISIIAEVFMAGIEQITSQAVEVTVNKIDDNGNEYKEKVRTLIWNPTVANLTLMALGSSAPEILLAVLETVDTLPPENCPGELGASTIVGSAAFNLLVISGLSILAVSKENDTDPRRDQDCEVGVKKINDLGVFGISSIFSIFAYIWLWYVLMDQNVEAWEAAVTFALFWVLVLLCYGADRYKASKD